tara:strand:+ start:466 stop:1074 length:609 start_codon:yes stop_codon:yes gene_type:complete
MNYLAIDTSTNICSVCLYVDNKIIDQKNVITDNNHSKFLASLVLDIIQENKIKFSIIDYYLLSIGPGSYSGLKVGSSFLKGLAYTQDKPIIPINTIDSINSKITNDENYYIALYSHRNYVYYQEFIKGKPIGEQACDLISNLKKIKIYGYGLDRIDNLEYVELKPLAANLIEYFIANKSKIKKVKNSDISPLFLSMTKIKND